MNNLRLPFAEQINNNALTTLKGFRRVEDLLPAINLHEQEAQPLWAVPDDVDSSTAQDERSVDAVQTARRQLGEALYPNSILRNPLTSLGEFTPNEYHPSNLCRLSFFPGAGIYDPTPLNCTPLFPTKRTAHRLTYDSLTTGFCTTALTTASNSIGAIVALGLGVSGIQSLQKVWQPFLDHAFNQQAQNIDLSANLTFAQLVQELREAKSAGGIEAELSAELLQSIEEVGNILAGPIKRPEVEVDDTTNSVTVFWLTEDKGECFSLVFTEDAFVIGVRSKLGFGSPLPWKFHVSERDKIVQAISDLPSFVKPIQQQPVKQNYW